MNIYEKFIEDSKLIQDTIRDDIINDEKSKYNKIQEFVEYLKETENIEILENFYEKNDFEYNDDDSNYIVNLFNKYDHISFEEFLIYNYSKCINMETQINQSTGKEELSIYQRLYNNYLEFCKNKTNLKTLFDYVCFRGFERLFDFLLPKIEEFNYPFKFACEGGQLKIVKTLEIHISDFRFGFSIACEYGKLEVVEYLISKVPEYQIACGFVTSCEYNNKEIFNFLINQVADEDKKHGFVNSAGAGNIEIAKILYPFADVCDKNTAFIKACQYDKIEGVKFLINDNITNSSKHEGFLLQNNPEIFHLLYPFVENNTEILEERFIHDCENDNIEFVKFLFDDVNVNLGHAISTAVKNSSINVLNFFIDRESDKNDIFDLACTFNSLDVVKEYVDDVDDGTIEYGFEEAAHEMYTDIVDFLFDRIDEKALKEIMREVGYEAKEYLERKIMMNK